MSTKQYYDLSEIKAGPYFNNFKTIIETPFYGNNVYEVETPAEAYKFAANAPGTVVTDMPIFGADKVGLPKDATVLVFNDGSVQGRCAAARRIIGEPGVDADALQKIIRDAIFDTKDKNMLKTSAYVGLSPEFMVKAHLMIPDTFANSLLSWLLNFQYCNEYYNEMYSHLPPSKVSRISSCSQIPSGLTRISRWAFSLFDPEHNVACVLGMRYFGELKKGTLTLAWGIAGRHGWCSCHGGQKRYNLPGGKKFVSAVFGLSGSGKSTITHAKHDNKYDVTVLHDDAFVIDTGAKTISGARWSRAYFDKTQDYPADSEDNKFLMTVQNNGITVDKNGKVVIVPEDIRNGNGRAVKSRLWSPNRVDHVRGASERHHLADERPDAAPRP